MNGPIAGVDPLPETTRELLEWLDERYPARCIARGQSPEEAHRYAGKRELVEELLTKWEIDDEGSVLR